MKKLLLCLLTVVGFAMSTEAQTVVVQKNETITKQTQDPNIFYINGIPSTQDIGGIDIEARDGFDGTYSLAKSSQNYNVKFKNYNSVIVTVLYSITTSKGTRTGSIVLKPNEEKVVEENYNYGTVKNVATITRKLQ